jgi:TonB family protein
MSETWKQWEGFAVEGKFPLHRFLGGSEHCAVFLTERHDRQRLVKAAIKLLFTAPEIADLQLSRWQQAAELSHPHLIPLYEMGRSEVVDVTFAYVVMECAEENLAQVLPGRPLSAEEARSMLDSVLDVLAYLHRRGFVHGHIKPANIMASGEELKVSSDGLYQAGETLDDRGNQDPYAAPENTRGKLSIPQPMSPASDVWSLGMTLAETLTQNLPELRTAERKDPLLPQTLQEPFLEIANHSLRRSPQDRWTVAQIAARLQGTVAVPPVPTAPREASPPQVIAPRPITQQPKAASKQYKYAAAAGVGAVLGFAVILAGSKMLHRTSETPQSPAAGIEQPVVPPAPVKSAPAPQKNLSKPHAPDVAEEERSSRSPVPAPALIHPETMNQEPTDTAAKFAVGSPGHGEVIHKAMPEVLESATRSIRGTVRVTVRVNVDRSGGVEDAQVESRGPSKYFARASLDAARDWKFKPPQVGGRGVLSTWTLRFEFTRDQTSVFPTQELP